MEFMQYPNADYSLLGQLY